MDKCNYPLDGIYPCLQETQLCLYTAEISGTEFSLSKEKFREGKKLQQFGKVFVNLEVLFSKMPPVSSVEELDTSQEQLPPAHPFPSSAKAP